MIPSRTTAPVLIAGPTASGKSALALALAERVGGAIINADAGQVYACWRLLTARPDDADLARAPHRLYGHVDGAQRYSVGDWLRDIAVALEQTRTAGQRPIVVGGTGLYIDALTRGLAFIPPIPPAVHAESEAMLAAGALEAMLAALDPETRSRIDQRNPMRVQRAWDVLTATGRGLAAWQDAPRLPPLVPEAVRMLVSPDTPELDARIARRFHAMIEAGAIDEVDRFAAAGLGRTGPAARVLGAPQLLAWRRGETNLDAAISAAITATRQFAKRQRTWFRNRMADWPQASPGAATIEILQGIA